jgi:hypothetical protein
MLARMMPQQVEASQKKARRQRPRRTLCFRPTSATYAPAKCFRGFWVDDLTNKKRRAASGHAGRCAFGPHRQLTRRQNVFEVFGWTTLPTLGKDLCDDQQRLKMFSRFVIGF